MSLWPSQTDDLQRALTNVRLTDPLAGMFEHDLIDDGARVARGLRRGHATSRQVEIDDYTNIIPWHTCVEEVWSQYRVTVI